MERMTFAAYFNKHGAVKALKAIGYEDLAVQLKEVEEYRDLVVEEEGIRPIEERPLSTQRKLMEASKVALECDRIIAMNYKKYIVVSS